MAWRKYKTIIETQRVYEAVSSFQSRWPRFDDAWEALKWLLARSADSLGLRRVVEQTEYRLYAQAGDAIGQIPRIVVVYRADENEVVIEGIRASDPPPMPDPEALE